MNSLYVEIFMFISDARMICNTVKSKKGTYAFYPRKYLNRKKVLGFSISN